MLVQAFNLNIVALISFGVFFFLNERNNAILVVLLILKGLNGL